MKKRDFDEFSDDDEGDFKDLIIYWRIDEGKGGKIADLSNSACRATFSLIRWSFLLISVDFHRLFHFSGRFGKITLKWTADLLLIYGPQK